MKPILFNTEMTRAIIDGRKTATRRVVKPQPNGQLVLLRDGSCWPGYFGEADTPRVVRPPYFVGDILYVRETWCLNNFGYHYRADDNDQWISCDDVWHPSIHMPKEAARLFLRVKDVRVERLRDMATADMVKEGMNAQEAIHSPWKWHELWDSTIKPTDRAIYGWAANPWVWVIEFERISKEEE